MEEEEEDCLCGLKLKQQVAVLEMFEQLADLSYIYGLPMVTTRFRQNGSSNIRRKGTHLSKCAPSSLLTTLLLNAIGSR